MAKATRRRPAGEAGLAVIDLMAAAMVLAILGAIAIPAFFGFHRGAQDRSAQSEIARVLAHEKTLWQERGEYTDATGDLSALVPGVVGDGADPGAGVTLTVNRPAGTLCIERASGSGVTFAVWESAELGTFYGRGGGLTGACPGTPPAGYTSDGW